MDNNRTKDKTMDSNFSLEFDDFSFAYEQENLADIEIDWDSSFSCTSEPENTVVNNSDKTANQDNSPSTRFVGITEDEKSAFLKDQKNANTIRKTEGNVKLFYEFLKHKGVEKNLEEIPAAELCTHMETFVLSVRKENGGNYQPCTLQAMISSVFRYLKDKKYNRDLQSPEFSGLRDVLKAKNKVCSLTG